jgi:hypothetical protein
MPPAAAVAAYFKVVVVNGEKVQKCLICGNPYKLSTGSSSLEKHIFNTSNHDVQADKLRIALLRAGRQLPLYDQRKQQHTLSSSMASAAGNSDQVDLTLPPAKRQKAAQLNLERAFLPTQNAVMLEEVAKVFAKLSWPHLTADRKEFQDLFNAIRRSTHPAPTRAAIAREQKRIESRMRADVLVRLRQGPISIAFDGWTNTRHDKVTNIMPISTDHPAAFYWCSKVNRAKGNAVNILEQLRPVIEQLMKERLIVVAIVADNESVNNSV